MMNVTKRLSAILAAMIMVFCTPLFVFAAGQTELRDDAELFTSEEETQLQAELDAFVQKTGWVAVIYTNNEGKTEDNIKPFANRYYADKYGKTTAGVILTIDMEGRAIDFRTKGDAMYYFGDGRVNTLLDNVQYDMKQGNYYSAAEQFLYYVDHYYDEGVDDDESNENIDLQEKEDNKFLYVVKHYGIVIAGGSIIVAVIVVIVVKNRYKHNGKAGTYDLKKNSKTMLTDKKDIFLTKHVSVTRIRSDSDSSGGSSSSSSGGGGSSGGGEDAAPSERQVARIVNRGIAVKVGCRWGSNVRLPCCVLVLGSSKVYVVGNDFDCRAVLAALVLIAAALQAAINGNQGAFLEVFAHKFSGFVPGDNVKEVGLVLPVRVLAPTVNSNVEGCHALAGRGLAHFRVAHKAAHNGDNI